jgi:hypothetical protein
MHTKSQRCQGSDAIVCNGTIQPADAHRAALKTIQTHDCLEAEYAYAW